VDAAVVLMVDVLGPVVAETVVTQFLFKTYCVDVGALVLVLEGNRSVTFVCMKQAPGITSTARQDDIDKHNDKQSDVGVGG
jgi:hypothetical protein